MLSVRGSRELQAATLALKGADRDLRRMIYAAMRDTMNPVWQRAVAEQMTAGIDSKVIMPGTLIKAGNPPVMQAAASKRKVGRGIIPNDMWAGFEYGANRESFSRYTRKTKRGGQVQVERRTMRHLRPRKRGGYVLGPAVAKVAPRLAALATQVVVKTYMDILDGGK